MSTRMRGSGVVQSLKSWASKLHPQLPLNTKESQRLLTALTSSFREQLDQAHPVRPTDQDSRALKPAKPKDGPRALHASSVDLADRHLTSILTNPLLARSYGTSKPVMDHTSAQKSFLQNPFQDTVSLLEEYHNNGAATVAIAALCLEKLQWQLDQLSSSDRAKVVDERRAGIRTLNWLLQSGLHDTDDFVDDARFKDVLVALLVEEGKEDIIWQWLHTDVRLGSQDERFTKPDKQRFYSYRWKGRLFAALIRCLLEHGRRIGAADAALDAVFRAYELQINIHLIAAAVKIKRNFEDRTNPFLDTDPTRLDRFMKIYPSWCVHPLTVEDDIAILWMYHPRHPTGRYYHDYIKRLFGPHPPLGAKIKLNSIEKPLSQLKQYGYYYRFIRAISLLRAGGDSREADWLMAQLERIYPDLQAYNGENVEKELRAISRAATAQEDKIPASARNATPADPVRDLHEDEWEGSTYNISDAVWTGKGTAKT